MHADTSRGRRTAPWIHLGLCLLYVPVTVWATWPLAPRAADHVVDAVALQGPSGLVTQADGLLVLWALAWEVHALLTAPLSVLDGNIFFPARWTLARSDHFLGSLPLSAPFYVISDNPVLAHQAAILLACLLSAIATYAAVWCWLRRAEAAFVAGVLFGLAPWRLAWLVHIQTLATMYLPLVVLAGMGALVRGGRGWWLALGTAIVLQALCSAHLGVMAFTAAGAVLLGSCIRSGGRLRRRAWIYLGVLAGAAILSCLPYLPSSRLQRAGEIPATTRPVQELASAAPMASYFPGVGSRKGSPYFLSISAAVLGLMGLAAPLGRLGLDGGSPHVAQLRVVAAAIGATGYVLSLGPTLRLPGDLALPLPFRLVAILPGLSVFRAPVRFGVLVALAASILAGIGLAAVCAASRRRWQRVVLVAAALGIFAVEVHRLDVPLRPLATGDAVPPVYRWLAVHGGGKPVLELPVGIDSAEFGAMYAQSRYTYFSTFHWSPLLNGHGAYPPESFFLLMAIARRLPARDALQDLVDLTGLGWIVLHDQPRGGTEAGSWVTGSGGLARVGAFGKDALLRVTLEQRRDLRRALAWPSRAPTTLSGLPLRPLPPQAMRGALRDLELPSVSRRGLTFQGWVTVANWSAATWPGFRADPDGLLHLSYRWLDESGQQINTPPRLTRVPMDVAPGESVRVPFAVAPPPRPGRYRLRVTLLQKEGAWFDEHDGPIAEATVDVKP